MQYALIESGRVANLIEADDAAFIATLPGQWVPAADGAHIGGGYDGQQFTAPEPAEPAPADARITRLAFRQRFTSAEQIAIELASIDNPSGTIEQRQQQAALRVYLKNVDAAQYIDLAAADVAAGVQQLEAIGLIAAGRAEQILGAAVQEAERA